MPAFTADDLDRVGVLLRLLIQGAAKVGKTTAAIATAPGPVFIIACDDDSSLMEAARHRRDFFGERVTIKGPLAEMDNAKIAAKKAIKERGVKTIVIDQFNAFSDMIADELEAQYDFNGQGANGMQLWPAYLKKLTATLNYLFMLPAHVIVTSLYDDYKQKDADEGIQPMLIGKARKLIPAMFRDVVYMVNKREKGEKTIHRLFLTSLEGVYSGVGARSLSGHITECPADIKEFLRHAEKQRTADRVKPKSINNKR